MALSYSLRLICLILSCLGILQFAAEFILWALAPLLLRLAARSSARQREQTIYAVQILPAYLAISCVALAFVPNYILHETNLASERVGWFCLAFAAAIAGWYGAGLYRGVHMLMVTTRFTRACKRSSERLPTSHEQPPILTFRELPNRLALIGLLRPFILISSSLLEGDLDPLALEVVLDHERAHAVQHDNWKLLSLQSLPRLNLVLRNGRTWMQLWRNAAECAADDDAVRGETARALLLAEALVSFSRYTSSEESPFVSTALVCGETDLVHRVERLIQPVPPSNAEEGRKGLVLLCSTLAGVIALTMLLPFLGDLPEHILHLG
jgi:Zn-dependent protease with chaperone function